MKVFEAKITHQVADYLFENLRYITNFETANLKIFEAFGIQTFFENNAELKLLIESISFSCNIVSEPDREEYGDFQTNEGLADRVALHLTDKNISPEIVIEPTCGKGNFIIASLKNFTTLKTIYGIEIYKPYVWETKFSIIDHFLKNPTAIKPDITITHCNVFDFDFKKIAKQYATNETLIIGNPPWVTNSKLGSLNSTNLPKKTNFKNHSGLDAMTGKGNFDIAEFITMTLIETFQNMTGNLVLLVKNSVIKNIVLDQRKNKFLISDIEKYCIDSKKEFNVSVEASMLYCKLKSKSEFDCKEFNFYDNEKYYLQFGWLHDKFVSNTDAYFHTQKIDGVCPFVWRQGLKHDCSSVMELDKIDNHYVNALNEKVSLEDELVYGFLKSSDLKNTVITETRKYTIVTQKKVGQETKYIKEFYPQTYKYLIDHKSNFDARKSSIYNNKPSFSIFGIGDYSFKPFKVAISGMYKTFHFTLILPQNGKPVMLDDTCYLIGFDEIEFAVYTLILLNSDTAMQFLRSVTFPDAKRTFTKDVLMRINLLELAKKLDKNYLELELKSLNGMYSLSLELNLWEKFIKEMTPMKSRQTLLFD